MRHKENKLSLRKAKNVKTGEIGQNDVDSVLLSLLLMAFLEYLGILLQCFDNLSECYTIYKFNFNFLC